MKFFINLILQLSPSVSILQMPNYLVRIGSEKQEWNQNERLHTRNELSQDVEYVRLRRKLNELITDDHDHYAEQYEYSATAVLDIGIERKDGNFLLVII